MDVLTMDLDWSTTLLQRFCERPEMLRIGASVIYPRRGVVEINGSRQKLRAKELDLLLHLHEHVGETFTREELLRQVWNCQDDLVTRTVDQTVATLRRKIGDSADEPRYLLTIYGVGYQLSLESCPANAVPTPR